MRMQVTVMADAAQKLRYRTPATPPPISSSRIRADDSLLNANASHLHSARPPFTFSEGKQLCETCMMARG